MKFNTKNTTKTTNHEGGVGYSQSVEQELYLLVCNSLVENKFYETNEEQMKRLVDLIKKNTPEFCVKLCMYVREKMYMRSITHVMAVEIAQVHKGVAKDLIERICQRADDMTEILAYQISKYGKPIPNQIKKGLASAFIKFNEYSLGKYDRKGTVTLKDVIFISHPKQTELTTKVVEGKLETPYTWEVELSTKGNTKEVWEELIDSEKVGFMALLRNLRNIINVCDYEHIEKVCNVLSNEEMILKSKQLPFRFYSAYRELQNNESMHTSMVLDTIENACAISTKNLKLSGSSMIASDVSGSMESNISGRSKIMMIEIGLVMQGIAKQISKQSITGIFGDILMIKNYGSGKVFDPVRMYKEGEVGYSTNGYKVIEYLNNKQLFVDNILLFTDCEMYGGSIQSELVKYRKINPNVKVFIFNLSGYSTVQFPENSVYTIGGWSEKIFDFIEAVEDNKILDIIKNYK